MSVHALIIPNTFPSQDHPVQGIFFKEQVQALAHAGVNVGVISPTLFSVKELPKFRQRKMRLGKIFQQDEEYPVLRKATYNLVPGHSAYQERIYRRFVRDLYQAYKKQFGKPDLLHAHVGLWAGVSAARVAREEDLPLVLTEHSSALKRGLLTKAQQKKLTQAYQSSDAVIAVSTSLAESMKPWLGEKQAQVIPNLVDFSAFTLSSERDADRLLAISSLTANKGLDVLLQAMVIVKKSFPDLKLTIAGDGPEKERLHNQMNSLGLEGQVNFLGRVNKSEVPGLMQKAGVFISSSYVETFGLVMAEALATGLPVVATRSGGPEDFIDASNGALCSPGNPEELAKAIIAVRKQVALFSPEKLRSDVIQRFEAPAVAQSILSVYHSVLGI